MRYRRDQSDDQEHWLGLPLAILAGAIVALGLCLGLALGGKHG